MSITSEKAAIRARLLAVRAALSPEEVEARSRRIAQRLWELPFAATASAWFVYVGVGREVRTRPLIETLWQRGTLVCVPRMTGPGEMQAVTLRAWDELLPASGGLWTPRPDATIPDHAIDTAVVPGVAFSPAGDRLGRGGGYYDRWLARHRPRRVIGLAFEDQIVDHLPAEPHDQRMDLVVTEARSLVPSSP